MGVSESETCDSLLRANKPIIEEDSMETHQWLTGEK